MISGEYQNQDENCERSDGGETGLVKHGHGPVSSGFATGPGNVRTATVPHTQHAVANLSMMVLRDNRRFGNPALRPAHGSRPRGSWRGFGPRPSPAGEAGNG